jgi:hypothetical protein
VQHKPPVQNKKNQATRLCPFLVGIFFGGYSLVDLDGAAQSNSAVTNSAAPAATSVTTGGSNLTYQSNNTYQNEFGFAPGVFCRTPAIFAGGNLNRGDTDNYSSDLTSARSYNDNWNYGGQLGLVVPFGSPILDYCNKVARQHALDKEISTQLSLIRACASLARDGIVVDPAKYPLLKTCVIKEGDLPLLAPVPQTIKSASTAPASHTAPSSPASNSKSKYSDRPVGQPKIPRLSDG